MFDLPTQGVGDSFRRPTSHAKAMVIKGPDQLGDARRTVYGQVHGEYVT
jgi:hypothetical protein